MKRIKILIISRHTEIGGVLLRLVNSNPKWEGFLALTDDEAMNLFKVIGIDLVLLGSGIPEASESVLRSYFQSIKPNCIILQHYGGGSGLLKNEIEEALENDIESF